MEVILHSVLMKLMEAEVSYHGLALSLFISLTLQKQGAPLLPIQQLCCQQMRNSGKAPIAAAIEVRTEESQLTDKVPSN